MNKVRKFLHRPDVVYSSVGRIISAFKWVNINTPIFIVGTGRCGTSLLVDILSTNRDINVFPTEALDLFHPGLYPYKQRKVDCAPFWFDPGKFAETSRRYWPENHKNAIKRIFLGQHYLAGNKRHFIVKSTMVSHMIPIIVEMFAEAKFIHIYRHGVPFVNSFLEKEWDKYKKEYSYEGFARGVSNYWNECILEIEEQKKSLLDSDRILEFKYEELCTAPVQVLERISGYLGCAESDFSYDLTRITNRNEKSGDVNSDRYRDYSIIMDDGLKLKGYIPSG